MISSVSFLSRSRRIALHSAGNFLAAEKDIFTSVSAHTDVNLREAGGIVRFGKVGAGRRAVVAIPPS